MFSSLHVDHPVLDTIPHFLTSWQDLVSRQDEAVGTLIPELESNGELGLSSLADVIGTAAASCVESLA